MYGYIYKITNKVNGKIYVGQHKATKFEPENYFGSGKLLIQAINKYGKENFICELLTECVSQEDMDEKERFYIQYLDCMNLTTGYNLVSGGYGGSSSCSSETRERLHDQNLGRIFVNDGKRMCRIFPEQLLEYQERGFIQGTLPFSRTESFKRKLSESTEGKKAMHKVLPDGSIKTCWGYPDKVENLLQDGWKFGWKPQKSESSRSVVKEPRKYMYKDGIYKLVPESSTGSYLNEGWIFQCFTKGKSPWNKNKTMSEDQRNKLSIAHIGEKHTPERIEKHAASLRGRIYMNKDGVNKLIPKGDENSYLQDGWQPGRKSMKL